MTPEEKDKIRQAKKQSVSHELKSFPNFVISEPVTIRQSVFQQNSTAQLRANQSIADGAANDLTSESGKIKISLASHKLDNDFFDLLISPKTNANGMETITKPNTASSNTFSFSNVVASQQNQLPNTSLGSMMDDGDQTAGLLEPMQCVSINENSLQNQSSASKASEQSHFSIENPYTMQFNLNMTSIKNSTVLGTPLRKNMNQINPQYIHQQSIHIKDEPFSIAPTGINSPECVDTSAELNFSFELTEGERAKMRERKKSIANKSIKCIGNSANVSTSSSAIQPQKVASDNNKIDSDVVVIEDTDDISALLKSAKPENSIYINRSECRYTPVPLSEWEADPNGDAENKYDFNLERTQVSGFNVQEANMNLNPFDTDLQNNLLTEIQFVDYISKLDNCTMVYRVQPIYSNEPYAIGEKEFDIQKMIGRGSFAFVYRLVIFFIAIFSSILVVN